MEANSQGYLIMTIPKFNMKIFILNWCESRCCMFFTTWEPYKLPTYSLAHLYVTTCSANHKSELKPDCHWIPMPKTYIKERTAPLLPILLHRTSAQSCEGYEYTQGLHIRANLTLCVIYIRSMTRKATCRFSKQGSKAKLGSGNAMKNLITLAQQLALQINGGGGIHHLSMVRFHVYRECIDCAARNF